MAGQLRFPPACRRLAARLLWAVLSGIVQLASGGSLAVPSGGEYVGYTGTGTFSQTGGTHSVANSIYLGYSTSGAGSYNLSGGSLAALNEYVGYSGSGAFTQTAGANSVASNVYLGCNDRFLGVIEVPGGSGTYSLRIGESITVLITLRRDGIASRWSVMTTEKPTLIDSLVLSGGSLATSGSLVVGLSGNGTFTQTGGVVSVTNSASLGYNIDTNGAYGINDGGSSLTVNGTADVSEWINAGVITINSSGLLNNHVSDLTSYGGARVYVNSSGTLNANSEGEGTTLDLQDSLLVNNGIISGTTNVNYWGPRPGQRHVWPYQCLRRRHALDFAQLQSSARRRSFPAAASPVRASRQYQ